MKNRDSAYYTAGIMERLNDFDKQEHDFRYGLIYDIVYNNMKGYQLDSLSKYIRKFVLDFIQTCRDNGVEVPGCYYMAEDVLDYLMSYFDGLTQSAIQQKETIMKERREMNSFKRMFTQRKFNKDLVQALGILVLKYNDLALFIKEFNLEEHAIDILNYTLHNSEEKDMHKIVEYHKAYYSKCGYKEIVEEIKQRD